MKKRKGKLRTHIRKQKEKGYSPFFGYFIIVSGVVIFLGLGELTAASLQKTHVLGQSTVLLAKGGDDINSGEDGHTGNPGNNGPIQPTFQSSLHPTKLPEQELENNARNTFHGTSNQNNTFPTQKIVDKHGPEEINKVKQGSTAAEHKNHDALDDANDVSKENGVEIGTNAAHDGFLLRKGNIQAETHFPLSVNPVTNALTITTPSGEKTVTILPDKAVENLLSHNIFNKIENNASGSADNTQISLTQLNNEPVFTVPGVKSKRLFGFIPVDIAKTAFVSAQTGQLIKTDESFGNSLLEALSL